MNGAAKGMLPVLIFLYIISPWTSLTLDQMSQSSREIMHSKEKYALYSCGMIVSGMMNSVDALLPWDQKIIEKKWHGEQII